MSKSVLVTGASGFIGGRVASYFEEKGCRVTRMRGRPDRSIEHRSWVESVVWNCEPDYVVHCAAYGVSPSERGATDMFRTNVDGVFNLLDVLHKWGRLERMIHLGSAVEYAFSEAPLREDSFLQPASLHGVTKVAGTGLAQYYAGKHELPVVVLRPFSVFGPGEQPRRFMPTLIRAGLRGTLPKLVKRDVKRDWVYIDDVVTAIHWALADPQDQRGEIFNIGTGRQLTMGDVVRYARSVMDIDEEPVWGSFPDCQYDSELGWYADMFRSASRLKWTASYNFETAFLEYIKHIEREGAAHETEGVGSVPGRSGEVRSGEAAVAE